jgi:DNA (cytosine-5)-methyltransferase 1
LGDTNNKIDNVFYILKALSMNHIELFAGCGGLSLGLEAVGFELLMANELSPMAAESFAYNFFNEDLSLLAKSDERPTKTIWLNSKFPDLQSRARENPFHFPAFDQEGFSDLPKDKSELKNKLVVGSIVELNRLLESDSGLANLLQSGFSSDQSLDVVSGGPPCQSFSMAGLRQRDSEKNTLPWEFAKFVKYTQPKIAMLENVTGILRAFKGDNGESFHAWYEVAKVFASIGYVPLCLHVNARYAGIAQNRPRFIMIALRLDQYLSISEEFSPESAEFKLFTPSLAFYNLVQTNGDSLEYGHLGYFDVTKKEHKCLFEKSFLAPLVNGKLVTVRDAIDDLKQSYPSEPSKYIDFINNKFQFLKGRAELANHEFRNNGQIVQRRFRIYQVLQKIDDRAVTQDVFSILKGNAESLKKSTWEQCRSYEYLQINGNLKRFSLKRDFESYLKIHPTKKQTQKALNADSAAPAALSIPDDACHYDENELRVLTVREMARIQSFPDSFVFKSKITTGGQMRKFEVPQYTQVGNAVPPLLGIKLGECLADLLSKCD